jgi:transposase-like protein
LETESRFVIPKSQRPNDQRTGETGENMTPPSIAFRTDPTKASTPAAPLPPAALAVGSAPEPPADLLYTPADLLRDFPDDDVCLEYIKEQIWPQGLAFCMKCGVARKHYRVTGRKAYACNHCGHHIYPLAGTIFSKSTTPLQTWFYIVYLMLSTGGQLSARQIQRETGVTYKTAWRSRSQILGLLHGDSQVAAGDEPARNDHPANNGEKH